jgi:hypothetical protein
MAHDNDDILNMFSKSTPPESKGSSAPRAKRTCVVQYGTETRMVNVRDGLSVQAAFRENAAELGFDPDRAVTFRAQGVLVDPNTQVKENTVYMAAAAHEQKG